MKIVANWALALDIASREETEELRASSRKYALEVLRGNIPYSTMGRYYEGKFSVGELLCLRRVGVPVCFHRLTAGMQYYIPAGTCHIFWNESEVAASSLAHDCIDRECCSEALDFFSRLDVLVATRPAADRVPKVPKGKREVLDHSAQVSIIASIVKEAPSAGEHCACGALYLDMSHRDKIQTPSDFFSLLSKRDTVIVYLEGWTAADTLQHLSDFAERKPVPRSSRNNWSFFSRSDSLAELVTLMRVYVHLNTVLFATLPEELRCQDDDVVLDLLRRNNKRRVLARETDYTNMGSHLIRRICEWDKKGKRDVRKGLIELYNDLITLRLALLRATQPNAHLDTSVRRFLPSTVVRR